MPIKQKTWIIFGLLAVLAFFVWFKFSYSQLVFLQLKVNRQQAQELASEYLVKHGYNIADYRRTAVFLSDQETDRYLQRSLGFEGLQQFVATHDFDIFFWVVRFFKEGKKEEFRVGISSKSGEVINFRRTIEETAARPALSKEEAQVEAVAILQKQFGFDPQQYGNQEDSVDILDNRSDYMFSWQKKEVLIPWSDQKDSGFGKLVAAAIVTGGEVLSFSKNMFQIPDDYARDLQRQRDTGNNITSVVRIFYYILLIAAINIIVRQRNHLAMHVTRRFYWTLAVSLFVVSILNALNLFEVDLFNYKTSGDFNSYIARGMLDTIIESLFFSVLILMPGLAGELRHFEPHREAKEGAFLTYVRSTFLSVSVGKSIILGYCVFAMMLGIQSVLFYVGQHYLNVWTEYAWMTQMSTAYFPVFVGIVIGFSASIQEELFYRLFAINWLQGVFKRWNVNPKAVVILAVVLASALWGFAHSNYPVYPMWFRGLEVTTLGIFLSIIYLRFGIIAVIVAHYLFDCFWTTAGYILGQSNAGYVYSSLFVMLLPLLFAIVAFIINRKVKPQPLRWKLSPHQQFNLGVLKSFLANHPPSKTEELKEEIISHGWDVAVVDTAFEDFEKPS